MDNPFKPTEKYGSVAIIIVFAAAFIGISVPALLNLKLDDPYLIASFGATAVLVFGAPKAAFSQPKNVFFGHLFSAIIGVCIAIAFDSLGLMNDYCYIAAGLAVATAIAVMMLTGTVHPPGGATALTCIMSNYTSPIYIIRPVMIGVVFLMIVAYASVKLREKYAQKNE